MLGVKKAIFTLLFLLPFFCGAQSVYTSQITQTWPTIFDTAYEEIERTISIEENAIQIGTRAKRGKEFETLYIQKIDHGNNRITYSCLTSKNELVTVVIPDRRPIAFVDLFRKSGKTGEEFQERYHVF